MVVVSIKMFSFATSHFDACEVDFTKSAAKSCGDTYVSRPSAFSFFRDASYDYDTTFQYVPFKAITFGWL
jgi:hypothetical protein